MTATAMKIVLLLAAGAGQLNDLAPPTVPRELCGPIAVQTVLRYFGKDVALPELTEEIFGESRGRFSSMAALSDSLRHHGLYTLPLEIGKDSRIAWEGPVILHLPSSSPDSAGHFAVMLPSARGEAYDSHETVSLSPGTTAPVPWRELSAARSRIILLTSIRPINGRRFLNELNRELYWSRWIVAVLLSACVVSFRFYFSPRRSFR